MESLEENDTFASATERWIQDGTYDAVIIFPPEISADPTVQMNQSRQSNCSTTLRRMNPRLL